MRLASNENELATLSTVLLTNLDVEIFFSQLTGFIQRQFKDKSVLGFEVLIDGSTRLRAQDGQIINKEILLAKGLGLSGYVARMKRAYYSNSVKRDPIASAGIKDSNIESELAIPVMVDSSIIGTINIQSDRKDRQFSEADIADLNELLNELKAPIKNLHLYLMAKNLNNELLSKIESNQILLSNKNESFQKSIVSNDVQLVGHSKKFLEIIQMVKKIATQDFPILLEGAHGVGKKSIAKKIHALSNRKGHCIVSSCSSLNDSLLEKELFSSKGALVQANNGTLIIDDIGSTSLGIQSKILRVMMTGEFIASDTQEKISLNVRFIFSSKTSLRVLTEEKKFLEELFYRLNTISMIIPPLKERKDDIKVLAEYFLNLNKSEAKILTAGAIDKLSHYFWPGNTHELKNVMERTYILTDGQYIEVNNLPEFAEEKKEEVQIVEQVHFTEATLFDLEKKHIIDTLDHLSGNKTRAAKALGITVKTLYNKLHSYGLIDSRETLNH
jgi:Nif-specific regulatory protein